VEARLRLTLLDGLSTFGPSAKWNDLNGLISVNENRFNDGKRWKQSMAE